MISLIDTHCHLSDPRLHEQLDDVLLRTSESGVRAMIAVATNANSSRLSLEMANEHANIFASVGIHPTYCHEAEEQDWDLICSLMSHRKVVAIGETGLDLYWKEVPIELQQIHFERHCQMSQQTGLPLIIHMRDSAPEMIQALKQSSQKGPVIGVLHSFTETWEVAKTLLDLGLYISFAGMVTYKKSEALRSVASRIPWDRILIETDSPYLSPEPFRSKRPNEPGMVIHTARCLAEVRNCTLEEVGLRTTENALRLFSRMSFGQSE